MHAVSFLKIVLEELIEGTCDLRKKKAEDLTNRQIFGYSSLISMILRNAENCVLVDYLPDYLKRSIYKFLLEDHGISEQQYSGFFNDNGYDIIAEEFFLDYDWKVVFIALNGVYVALLQNEDWIQNRDDPDGICIEFQEYPSNTATYEVFLKALQAAKEELLKQ